MDLKELENKKLNLEKKLLALDSIKIERNEARNNMNKAKEILNKESKDVEKMEKKSLKSFLNIIAGRYDKTFEKEKKEMLEAKLRYDQWKEVFAILDEKVNKYFLIKNELKNITKNYNEKLDIMKEKMLKENKKFKKVYKAKRRNYEKASKKLIKITEAIDAGKILLNDLKKAKTAFKSAANWGIFNVITGGLLYNIVKDDKVDKGKKILNRISVSLKDLNRELKNVEQTKVIDMNININISESLTLSELFFL